MEQRATRVFSVAVMNKDLRSFKNLGGLVGIIGRVLG